MEGTNSYVMWFITVIVDNRSGMFVRFQLTFYSNCVTCKTTAVIATSAE